MSTRKISRGSVYWVHLDPTIGTEIKKTRPAAVISNDVQNEFSNRVVVAPISSNVDNVYSFEVKIDVKNIPSKIMPDQLRSIDKIRIGKYICDLPRSTIKDLDKAIKLILSLD